MLYDKCNSKNIQQNKKKDKNAAKEMMNWGKMEMLRD